MIPQVIAAMAISGIKKVIKLLIDFFLLVLAVLIGLFCAGFEIVLHLYVWTGVVLVFFYLAGIKYEEWNQLVPFTFFFEEINASFPLVLGTMIIISLGLSLYVGLTFMRVKEKVLTIFVFIEVLDMLIVYVYFCICMAYKLLHPIGFTFSRWGYLYLAVIVVAAHVLVILSIYTYDSFKKYIAANRITW